MSEAEKTRLETIQFARTAAQLVNEGDTAAAQNLLSEGTGHHDRYPAGFQVLGDLFAREGDTGHAMEMYERALALDPQNPKLLLSMGRLSIAEHPEKAQDMIWRALRYEPGVAEIESALRDAIKAMESGDVEDLLPEEEESAVPEETASEEETPEVETEPDEDQAAGDEDALDMLAGLTEPDEIEISAEEPDSFEPGDSAETGELDTIDSVEEDEPEPAPEPDAPPHSEDDSIPRTDDDLDLSDMTKAALADLDHPVRPEPQEEKHQETAVESGGPDTTEIPQTAADIRFEEEMLSGGMHPGTAVQDSDESGEDLSLLAAELDTTEEAAEITEPQMPAAEQPGDVSSEEITADHPVISDEDSIAEEETSPAPESPETETDDTDDLAAGPEEPGDEGDIDDIVAGMEQDESDLTYLVGGNQQPETGEPADAYEDIEEAEIEAAVDDTGTENIDTELRPDTDTEPVIAEEDISVTEEPEEPSDDDESFDIGLISPALSDREDETPDQETESSDAGMVFPEPEPALPGVDAGTMEEVAAEPADIINIGPDMISEEPADSQPEAVIDISGPSEPEHAVDEPTDTETEVSDVIYEDRGTDEPVTDADEPDSAVRMEETDETPVMSESAEHIPVAAEQDEESAPIEPTAEMAAIEPEPQPEKTAPEADSAISQTDYSALLADMDLSSIEEEQNGMTGGILELDEEDLSGLTFDETTPESVEEPVISDEERAELSSLDSLMKTDEDTPEADESVYDIEDETDAGTTGTEESVSALTDIPDAEPETVVTDEPEAEPVSEDESAADMSPAEEQTAEETDTGIDYSDILFGGMTTDDDTPETPAPPETQTAEPDDASPEDTGQDSDRTGSGYEEMLAEIADGADETPDDDENTVIDWSLAQEAVTGTGSQDLSAHDSEAAERDNEVSPDEAEESPDTGTETVQELMKGTMNIRLDLSGGDNAAVDDSSLDSLISDYMSALSTYDGGTQAPEPVSVEPAEPAPEPPHAPDVISSGPKPATETSDNAQSPLEDISVEDIDDAADEPLKAEEATATMAEIFARQGLYSSAIDIYTHILERSPDDAKAKTRREELIRLRDEAPDSR